MDNESLIKKYLNEFSEKRSNPYIPFFIGVLYLDSADYENALSWFLKSSEIDKTLACTHFFSAMTSLCQDKYDVALLESESFLRYSKNPFEFYKDFNLPFEIDVKKIRDKSLNSVKYRVNLLPEDLDSAYTAGLAYTFWGKYEAAVSCFSNVLYLESLPVRLLMVLSELYLRDKNIDKAIEILKRLYWQEKNSVPIMMKLAELYIQTKDYTRASFLLRKVFEQRPLSPDVLTGLGITYRGLGQNDLAREMFNDALFIESNFVKAWFELGVLCEEEFLFKSALDFFYKTIELKPDLGEAYYHIGLTHKRNGNNEEAIPFFYKAIEYIGDDSSIHYTLGESLMVIKEYEEAVLEFFEVLKIDPLDAYAYMNAGRCLSLCGLYEGASHCLNKAMDVQQDFFEPLYYLGINYTREGRLKEALEVLYSFNEQKGQDTYARFALGNVYLREGLYESAIEEYMHAISLYPDHPYARYNLAASYACAGKYEKAQQEFTDALKICPPESEEEMILFAVFGSYQSILQRLAEAIVELNVYFKHNLDVENKLSAEEKTKNRIADLFKKVLPEKIAEDIISSGTPSDTTKDKLRNVTILFSDIRGYTKLTKSLGAENALKFLNEYYKYMSCIVSENKGTLLYFQGDAQMIIFGAPNDDSEHALHAIKTAESLKSQVSKIYIDTEMNVDISVGIASGDVLLGFINDGIRLQYTAIGEAVNTASRLQAFSKERSYSIILTEETYLKVKDLKEVPKIDFVDLVQLKGLDPMNVYEIVLNKE